MAAKINGVFELDDHSFDFTAIAFGRIGGQNIGAKLSDDTKKTLSDLDYNIDEVIDEGKAKMEELKGKADDIEKDLEKKLRKNK